MGIKSQLNAGDWVEVLSKREILEALDAAGELNGLPFMPEMFEFCGRRFKVTKRAHKTCDPPNGLAGRRMERAVHLEGVRCDGAAHGGCQAACLIYWKEDWVRKVSGPGAEAEVTVHGRYAQAATSDRPAGCTERDVIGRTRRRSDPADSGEPVYVCQSTQVAAATQPLRWWDLRQYVEDYTSGNARPFQLLSAFVFFVWHTLATAGLGLGAPLRWVYDRFQELRGGTPYPWRLGKIPSGTKTPSTVLNLQPGELVRVRSYPEILATLDQNGTNRGMWFDAEMVPFCGGTYRVLQRVGRIINEKTGRMQLLKNECIMLEDVVCRACYAKYRKFCPRGIPPYWREIWLERVNGNPNSR
jgi:hypothetical protein